MSEEDRTNTSPDEPSSPAFRALASSFGMAIGELALANGEARDVDLALREAEVAAKATLLSADWRSIR